MTFLEQIKFPEPFLNPLIKLDYLQIMSAINGGIYFTLLLESLSYIYIYVTSIIYFLKESTAQFFFENDKSKFNFF